MSSSATMQQAKTDAVKPVQHQQSSASNVRSEFTDQRPQATAQRQLQDTANNSPQSRQLQAFQQMAQNSARSTQLKAMSAMMNAPAVERVEEDDEPLQAKSAGETVQREAVGAAEAPKPNNTGLPDNLKSGIESLSGMSMDHVKVHYNSSQPAQLNAHAYAQGSEIHVAPGQEQHLPHEAWHVVQQAQGRVQPTMQMKAGVAVNDDASLEAEADVMGGKALGLEAVQIRAGGNVGMSELIESPELVSSPFNSNQPAQLNAHVYAQGSHIHVAPDQEQHLPHKAWHVVVQKQGWVRPTLEIKEQVSDNNNASCKRGENAIAIRTNLSLPAQAMPIQRKPIDFVELMPQDLRYTGMNLFNDWASVQSKISDYAALSPDNIRVRNTKLTEIRTSVNTWQQWFKQQKALKKLDVVEFERNEWATKSLARRLVGETSELELSAGSLADPAVATSANPRVAREYEPDDADVDGAMFKTDTDIVDAGGTKTTDGKQGKVLLTVKKWADDATTVKKATHAKVTPEDQARAGQNYLSFSPGWALKSAIMPVNRLTTQGGTKWTALNNKLDYPLFAHAPNKDDIIQVGLGDCYLLAALSAVAQTSPDHLVSHMKDHGDGTVSVKMYKALNDPIVVTIAKSVVMTDKFLGSKEVYANGAMWVKMYEKAYVAAGFYGSTIDTLPSTEKSFGMIEGGHADVALTHITGKAASKTNPGLGREDLVGALPDVIKKAILPQGPMLNDAQMEAVGKMQAVGKKIDALQNQTLVTIDDVVKILKSEAFIDQHIHAAKTALEQNRMLAGKVGSGKYAQRELDFFDILKADVDANKAIVVGTKKKIYDSADDIEDIGGSAGEAKVKGLAGPHAYTVLDYAPKVVDPSMPSRSIKLRNPWGSYGRKYMNGGVAVDISTGATFEGASSEAQKGGEFWLDLADVAAYCDSYVAA